MARSRSSRLRAAAVCARRLGRGLILSHSVFGGLFPPNVPEPPFIRPQPLIPMSDSRMRMNGIDPIDFFRWLGGLDIQVNDNWILTAADHHATENLSFACIDLLMRYEWRNVDEIARPCLCDKLQIYTPSHTCPAAHNVYDAFQFAMMVSSRFGIGINGDRACPKFASPRPRMCDCGRSRHARRLRCIEIELGARNDLDSVIAPIWL